MPAQGSDPANIVAFIKDLSFREVHAFTWGFGLIGIAVVAQSNGEPTIATAFYTAYAVILGRAMLGKSLRELLPNLTRLVNVPKYVIRQIRQEPHYYIGGGALAYALQDAPGVVATVQAYLPALPF